eukprot:GHVT01080220.1.p1 GENE.GHVT01080220.1~~GHVT01080220.1.p1  ORF type:complete len:489 (-),score=67.69 GHVT01080220.1:145-1611(-)
MPSEHTLGSGRPGGFSADLSPSSAPQAAAAGRPSGHDSRRSSFTSNVLPQGVGPLPAVPGGLAADNDAAANPSTETGPSGFPTVGGAARIDAVKDELRGYGMLADARLPRRQSLKFKNGFPVTNLEESPVASAQAAAQDAEALFRATYGKPPSGAGSTGSTSRTELLERRKDEAKNAVPTGFAWLSYGGVSLRFFGYFKEALEESMDGATYRVRRCVISFFPADGTLSVTEVRAGDSRASQGLFLSRRLAPYDRSLDICTCCSSNSTADVETAIGKPLNQVSFEDTPIDTPGKPNQPTRTVNYQEQTAGIGLTNSQSRERTLILTDLKLGHNLTLYSRTFRIFNCDPFTKRFCLSMGHDVGEAEEEPEVPPGRRLTAIPPHRPATSDDHCYSLATSWALPRVACQGLRGAGSRNKSAISCASGSILPACVPGAKSRAEDPSASPGCPRATAAAARRTRRRDGVAVHRHLGGCRRPAGQAVRVELLPFG